MAMAAIQNMTLKYSALDPVFGQAQYARIPMAVLGIVMKFFQIVISISVGLATGCIPVVGYNIGAVYGDSAYLGIEKREEIKRVMMVPATVNKGTFIYLQSLGRAFASTAISMVREVLFGVGFALLLPLRFGLDGALYSMPVSDLLTFAICLAAILYTYQTLNSSGARTPRLCGN